METYPANTIPLLPILVLGVGFIAAVVLGSIAWFNAKRPAGWEDSERPSYVPKVGESDPAQPSASSDQRDA